MRCQTKGRQRYVKKVVRATFNIIFATFVRSIIRKDNTKQHETVMKGKFTLLCLALICTVAVPSMVSDAYAQQPEKQMTKAQERRAKREAEKAAKIKFVDSLLTLGDFMFVGERLMSTAYGGNATLDANNGVAVSKNAGEVASYLPFVGTMYSAMPGNSESPLSFFSKRIEYEEKIKKAGNGKKWIITINMKPTSGSNNYKYVFDISETGSASLSVSQNNGSGSFFTGYIKELTTPEENK